MQNNWVRFNIRRNEMKYKVIPFLRSAGIDTSRIEHCGDFLKSLKCVECGAKHFAGFSRCKSKYCMNCNRVKSLAWVARIVPELQMYISNGYYVSMLNFTVRDGPDLRERLDFLRNAFKVIYNGRANRQRWKERFLAGVKSLEIKIGKGSGLWHPHIHCLVVHEYGKDYEWLFNEWKRITRGNGSVYIKTVKSNVLKSVCETVKYITKMNDILGDVEKFREFHDVTYKIKQISTWGKLRCIVKRIEEDMENWEEKKLAKFVCQRCGCTEAELESMLFDVNIILYDL